MIRRVMDFVMVLLFVWTCMLLGLWIIDSLIVPLSIPGSNRLVTGILQVIISASLVFLWLQIWRKLVERIFWRALRGQ